MKYSRFLIISFVLCLVFTACDSAGMEINTPVTYYYQASNIDYGSPNGILAPEERESEGHEGDYVYLIEQYLKGPESTACLSPFPEGTTLVSLNVLKDKVNVELSSEISQLTGHKLTIACTCLSKTLLDMTGLEAVTISASNTTIDGNPSITITKNNFILTDSNEYIPDNTK